MRKRIFLSTFALVLITTTLAWAQGYLNPPVYATGAIYVQSGGTVSTTVHQAANPANINVYAVGDITSWTVNMPFPAYIHRLPRWCCRYNHRCRNLARYSRSRWTRSMRHRQRDRRNISIFRYLPAMDAELLPGE